MAGVTHEKDRYGHNLWFGHPEIRFPVLDYVLDYNQLPNIIKYLELRPDDVIVAGYPKSGNHWTHHLTTMLLTGSLTVPPVLGPQTFIWLDAVGFHKQLPGPDKPRALMSHLRFRYLPRDVTEKKVKVVHVTRNPKDVFVSLFCHVQNYTGKLGYDGSWSQFFQLVLEKGWWYGDVLDHLLDWEKEMDNHPDFPILHISFEDMKQDPVGQVERLNTFLGTHRSQQFCRDVAEACHFPRMHLTRLFDADVVDTSDWDQQRPTTSFFRKGEVGDWKNWFTVAQSEQFDKVYRAKMADSKLRFTFQ